MLLWVHSHSNRSIVAEDFLIKSAKILQRTALVGRSIDIVTTVARWTKRTRRWSPHRKVPSVAVAASCQTTLIAILASVVEPRLACTMSDLDRCRNMSMRTQKVPHTFKRIELRLRATEWRATMTILAVQVVRLSISTTQWHQLHHQSKERVRDFSVRTWLTFSKSWLPSW